MSGISEKNLRLMATVSDAEYRVIDRPRGGKGMDADFGTFLGRMVRNLKINFGEDRIKKLEAYVAGKEEAASMSAIACETVTTPLTVVGKRLR